MLPETMTYQEISNRWFPLRLSKGVTLEQFEADPGVEDREKTGQLLHKMALQAPRTASELFGVQQFPLTLQSLSILDRGISPEIAAEWLRHSSALNPNNEFVRTVSEFAVHLGDTVLAELGGAWRYARAPNYFESIVIVDGCELYVFDILMKKCSEDFGNERILEKYNAFIKIVAESRKDH